METHAQQEQITLAMEQQSRATKYAHARLRLRVYAMGISAAGVLVLLLSGLGNWLRDLLSVPAWLSWQPVPGWFPLQILAYLLLVFLVYEVLTAPLSYYGGYVLSHRYGLSTQSQGAWLQDSCKGLGLNVVLEVVVIELVYALLAWQPENWWLWVALVLIFFMVVMANLAPILILPLFYRCTPVPEGELTRRLLILAQRANTRVRGVFVLHLSEKTTTANAALMGLGNTRRIVVGDTMLDRYTTDEIEVVLAHELGHHVHRDLWKLLGSQALFLLAGLYLANLAFHWGVQVQHFYPGFADPATLPFLFALMALSGLLVMPAGNGLSRVIEYQADEYALQVTRKVEAFKSAMLRLANQNLAEFEPSPLVEFLFHSHPSVHKRLRHADSFARRAGGV
ncbi:MAG TPA: M48 family metallopeptidase [Ktedonobacteraceae bacterium]|jgi:STE24 endopeptidase